MGIDIVMNTPVRKYIDEMFYEKPPEISNERMLMIRNIIAMEKIIDQKWNINVEEDLPGKRTPAIRE